MKKTIEPEIETNDHVAEESIITESNDLQMPDYGWGDISNMSSASQQIMQSAFEHLKANPDNLSPEARNTLMNDMKKFCERWDYMASNNRGNRHDALLNMQIFTPEKLEELEPTFKAVGFDFNQALIDAKKSQTSDMVNFQFDRLKPVKNELGDNFSGTIIGGKTYIDNATGKVIDLQSTESAVELPNLAHHETTSDIEK